ncbi:MAG TPA: hypothetical protein VGM06_23905 [Polyangiaceae bacterium]|jgi:hypothetical protein
MSRTLTTLLLLGLTTATPHCTTTVSTTPPPPSGGTASSSCAADDTVAGCGSPSTGYSCTGADTPADSDPTLACSVGEAGNAGSTIYCCLSGSFTASTCGPDDTVAGCAPGSFGFSCAASDTPDQTDSTLVCSVGVAGNAGSTLYCCTD